MAFSKRNVLLEVLQILELAERFVESALRAGPKVPGEDAQSLIEVRTQIRFAMLLAREQLN